MARMSDEEAFEFVASAPRTAKLATVRPDGRPHVAPVWVAVDGSSIVFNTGADTVKGRCLARDPRASMCFDDERPPFSFAIFDGTVTLSDDLDEVLRWATVIGGRYMGADRAEEFGARNGVPGELLARFVPNRILAERAIAD
jgi:PPOX class probable F420-dependent enzyme